MTMTPQDIQSKQFHVRFRGFDVEEVDEFLEQVAEQYMMLEEENKTLQLQVDTLQSDLDGLKVEESSFKEAIISAQKVAEEMKKKSREEADDLIAEAHQEVKNLKDEANREITELEYRVDELSGLQGKLQNELKSTIAKYLEKIDETFVATIVPHATGDESGQEVNLPHEVTSGEQLQGVDVDEVVNEHQTIDLEPERDLSDLYEKIDLDSITEPQESELDSVSDAEDYADVGITASDITDKLPSLDLDQAEDSLIPDLDDEVVFTLDDPLDTEDIDMPIASDDPEKANK